MSTVFRVEKTKGFTVMSNYHLRDKSLTLKAKGLLSVMLSLPDGWEFTLKGLASMSDDGLDSVKKLPLFEPGSRERIFIIGYAVNFYSGGFHYFIKHKSVPPIFSVKASVLKGFSNMPHVYFFAFVKVGDGSRNF